MNSKMRCDTEIYNFKLFAEFCVLREQHILRFDVSMCDSFLVEIVDGLQDLIYQLTGFDFTQPSLLFRELNQIASLAELSYYKNKSIIFEIFKNFQNIWVVHIFHQFDFSSELFAVWAIFDILSFVDDFNGSQVLSDDMDRFVNDSKGALAQFILEQVVLLNVCIPLLYEVGEGEV